MKKKQTRVPKEKIKVNTRISNKGEKAKSSVLSNTKFNPNILPYDDTEDRAYHFRVLGKI